VSIENELELGKCQLFDPEQIVELVDGLEEENLVFEILLQVLSVRVADDPLLEQEFHGIILDDLFVTTLKDFLGIILKHELGHFLVVEFDTLPIYSPLVTLKHGVQLVALAQIVPNIGLFIIQQHYQCLD